jgi:tetratricopeptide (TPR) repeat protein
LALPVEPRGNALRSKEMSITTAISPGSGTSISGKDAAASSPWIYKPWIDLVVGCGAWSAPLLLATSYVAGSKAAGWSFAFYMLALFFNYPHFMATVYRAYHSYDEFAKYRFFTVHAAVLLACAGLIAHLWYPLLPWIFTLYICWSPWHYTGQNFGLLMMFARRAGLAPTRHEREALHLSFTASYLMLLFSFHTGASGDALILSLELPAKFTLPARAMLGLFFVAATGWSLYSLAKRSNWRALLPTATLVTTQFLWFLLPALIELMSGQEVPQTRYSSGILAVLHSAQYLWITSYYQQKEARAAGRASWSFVPYLLTLVAGGIALFVPGPWIVSRLFHADFAASFLTFTALVNLHHFILDGAIWKLRDSRIASFLLDTREHGQAQDAERGSRVAAAFRWLAGRTLAARALRIGALVVLLVWGGIDRLHFYWANVPANLSSLERAAGLNPDDSAVQTRLARAAEAVGNTNAALAAFERAAEVSPGNLALQESYARALIAAGRNEDALALYQKVLARTPQNANALVNYGLLAQRLGRVQDAMESWQRAVAADPMQSNAQLYLAQALEQRGEMQSAARHYRAYLQVVSKHPAGHSGGGPTVISALIKVADADAARQKNYEAIQGYKAAAQFAERINLASLQSLALVHAATAQEQSGAFGEAAQSFQQALLLDETQGEERAAATDWYNFGKFLRRQRKAERLAFACFYRAEDLMSTTPGAELSAMVGAREESEARLGAEARGLGGKLSKLLSEALSLPPSAFPDAGR